MRRARLRLGVMEPALNTRASAPGQAPYGIIPDNDTPPQYDADLALAVLKGRGVSKIGIVDG